MSQIELNEKDCKIIYEIKALNIRLSKFYQIYNFRANKDIPENHYAAFVAIVDSKIKIMNELIDSVMLDSDAACCKEWYLAHWREYPVWDFKFIAKGNTPTHEFDFSFVVGKNTRFMKVIHNIEEMDKYKNELFPKFEPTKNVVVLRQTSGDSKIAFNSGYTGVEWFGEVVEQRASSFRARFYKKDEYHFERWIPKAWHRGFGRNEKGDTLVNYDLPYLERLEAEKAYSDLGKK